MAAGRNGGYRGTQFVERESSYDSYRREAAYPKDELDRSRNAGRVRGRDVRDRDRNRVRQKDIKEREAVNGGYRSSSSRSDSGGGGDSGGGPVGPSRCTNSLKRADREPGELSSDGSDDGIDMKSKGKDKDVSKLENGIEPGQAAKKRKFSPVVWDRDEGEVKESSRSRFAFTTISSRPAPSAPKSDQLSSGSVPENDGDVPHPRKEKSPDFQASPVYAPVEHNVLKVISETPEKLHDSSFQEDHWGNYEEAVQTEDEDYVTTRHISASRWAAHASSPVDEGEIYDVDKPKRRRNVTSSVFIESRVSKSSSSPEVGEVNKEGTDRAKARSSDSDVGIPSRPSSVKRVAENDADKEDFMDMDDEQNNAGISISMSETDSDDDEDSRGTPEPPTPPQRTVNMLQGCRNVDEFERLNKIDEGTYGVVYRARDKKTGEVVALKKVKMEKEREGFPLTSLREINILLSFHHPSTVDVKEVVVGSSLDSIFMVMEYMEHDLKALMETMKQPFSQSEVKCLMLQLLDGVKYLHDNWVLHRDLKTSNLLLNNRGELKICDFGLARQYGSPLKPYTHLVVTLWYRAPELLLGAKQYSTAIDMWSLGCIMAEMLAKEPLFNGRSEVDQLDKIFRILGTPNETIWPGFSKLPGVKVNFVKHQYNQLRKKFPASSFTGSPVLSDAGFDLLNRLLTYDPEKRITCDAALNHEWFREVPLPKSKEFMPTFPAHHAQDRRVRRVLKSPDPLEEQRRKELRQAELGTGGLFG